MVVIYINDNDEVDSIVLEGWGGQNKELVEGVDFETKHISQKAEAPSQASPAGRAYLASEEVDGVEPILAEDTPPVDPEAVSPEEVDQANNEAVAQASPELAEGPTDPEAGSGPALGNDPGLLPNQHGPFDELNETSDPATQPEGSEPVDPQVQQQEESQAKEAWRDTPAPTEGEDEVEDPTISSNVV